MYECLMQQTPNIGRCEREEKRYKNQYIGLLKQFMREYGYGDICGRVLKSLDRFIFDEFIFCNEEHRDVFWKMYSRWVKNTDRKDCKTMAVIYLLSTHREFGTILANYVSNPLFVLPKMDEYKANPDIYEGNTAKEIQEQLSRIFGAACDNNTEPESNEEIVEEPESDEKTFDFIIPGTYICDYRTGLKRAKRLLYNEKEYDKAYKALVRQAERGNVPAIFDLGKMYQTGLFVEADEEKANALFAKALEGYLQLEKQRESDFFEYQIGRIYALKTDFQDYEDARNWFELSADKGNAYAMFSLGNIHYYGNGTEVNYAKAFEYFKSSAERNCAHSFYRLGTMLRNGTGCDINVAESDKWFAKMIAHYSGKIDEEDALNCYRLGRLYEKGWGTDVNIETAKEYYLAACKSKNANAEFAVARLYFREGNEDECLKYIELAEEHGNEYAREWYENAKAYQARYQLETVFGSAAYLFCRLASIIEDDTDKKTDGFNKTIVDSKERKRTAKKKQSLGIKMG